MKTILNRKLLDWTAVKNRCRRTMGKDATDNEPSEKFRRTLLISEHSPIRLIEFDWSWKNIPYWVSTEWSRHKFEKFISSQRDDRVSSDTPRGEKPQDAPVSFDGYANMQNLIDAWRKRLCRNATKEARELAEDFKITLMSDTESFEEGRVLVPHCVYRCGCPEPKTCGWWKGFITWADFNAPWPREVWMSDIEKRYHVYNMWFTEHTTQGRCEK